MAFYGLGCVLVYLAPFASALVTLGNELWMQEKGLAALAQKVGVVCGVVVGKQDERLRLAAATLS